MQLNNKHFVLRLNSPRPTFPGDMTDAERAMMEQHVAYWTDQMQRGFAIAFGPVLDPKGTWGLAVVEVDAEAQVTELVAHDPATRFGLRTDVLPMARAFVRK